VALTRVSLLLFAVLIVWTAVSYTWAMMAPSSLPLTVRTVEWVRDSGGAALVDFAERFYYSATAPAAGGPGLTSLPGTAAARTGASTDGPPSVVVPVSPMLPGEGVWSGTGPTVDGAPPVRVTTFRPEVAYPRQVAYAAWVDTSRARLELYAGRKQPPDANPRGRMEVPPQLRGGLLATFNSGFTYRDSRGGFAVHGQTMEPMQAGQATVVEFADGRVDVQSWTGGPTVGPDVVLARQNLVLLVDHGVPSAALADESAWGHTLGNAIRVWRSAVGIDARGDLIYLAAPGQTASSLADAIILAGAVRAMQLDINSFWPTFNTYDRAGAAGASMLVPNPSQSAARYLTPDDRDFFAVYAAAKPAAGRTSQAATGSGSGR
jgi:hypothetical protein